jgi:hypothetical protein
MGKWRDQNPRRFPVVVQTQLLASILDGDKKRCCYLFLHDFSRLRQPAPAPVAQTGVRPRFLSERSEWKRYQKQKMGKGISDKKNVPAITKTETRAKTSQKVKQNHRHHLKYGHTNKRNTAMYMKKSNEKTTKLNLNMNRNAKVNMNRKMNMTINMKENLNEIELEHE